jgi:dimethylamine/trimethylamine dehydrogenase
MVTSRLPEDALYQELARDPEGLAQAGIKSLARIGDCLAPGTIAAAVWSGHRAARELEAEADPDAVPFRREITGLEAL